MIWLFLIAISVAIIVLNVFTIRNIRKARIHMQATEWYGTHNPRTDPKPDYVLKSEALRQAAHR